MSSTLRGRDRNRDDRYLTPAWCVRRLLDVGEHTDFEHGKWLEPAAGNGAIVRAVNSVREGIDWNAVELRGSPENRKGLNEIACVTIADFLGLSWNRRMYQVAITNPPFSLAEPFIAKCRKIASTTAMLLRLNFIGGARRADLLFRKDPPDIYILPNRPSFLPSGETDSIEYAWFVWHSDQPGGRYRILDTTPLDERKRDAVALFGSGARS